MRLARAAGTAKARDRRSVIPPEGPGGPEGPEDGSARVVASPGPGSPLPREIMVPCRFFHRIKTISRKITIAAPATPPTTPPTTTGVDGGVLDPDPLSFPAAAELEDALPEPTPVAPPRMTPGVAELARDEE